MTEEKLIDLACKQYGVSPEEVTVEWEGDAPRLIIKPFQPLNYIYVASVVKGDEEE